MKAGTIIALLVSLGVTIAEDTKEPTAWFMSEADACGRQDFDKIIGDGVYISDPAPITRESPPIVYIQWYKAEDASHPWCLQMAESRDWPCVHAQAEFRLDQQQVPAACIPLPPGIQNFRFLDGSCNEYANQMCGQSNGG